MKINIVFKQHLQAFFQRHFDFREQFIEGISKCKTTSELSLFFQDNADIIAYEIGADVDNDCMECDDLYQKLNDMREKVVEFETMNEDIKFQTFLEYQDKFTPQELEDLMK